MPTSSFDKEFIIDSQKAADSLTRILSMPPKSIKIDRSLTSAEKEKQGEERVRELLMRQDIIENK